MIVWKKKNIVKAEGDLLVFLIFWQKNVFTLFQFKSEVVIPSDLNYTKFN